MSENEPLFRLANIESLSLPGPAYGDTALVTGGPIADGEGANTGKTKHNSSSNPKFSSRKGKFYVEGFPHTESITSNESEGRLRVLIVKTPLLHDWMSF